MKNKFVTLVLLFIIIISGLLIINTSFVKADHHDTELETPGANELPNPIGTTDVPVLIGNIIKAVLGLVGSIALLMFISGGFRWILSGGNEEQVTKGKQTLIWASLGLAVVFMSYLVVKFIIEALLNSGG